MAIVNPQPGNEDEMAEVMRTFGKLLENSSGLMRVRVMKEKGKTTLLGISIWESEEAFDSAMQNVNPPPPLVPIETLRKDAQMRQFQEI